MLRKEESLPFFPLPPLSSISQYNLLREMIRYCSTTVLCAHNLLKMTHKCYMVPDECKFNFSLLCMLSSHFSLTSWHFPLKSEKWASLLQLIIFPTMIGDFKKETFFSLILRKVLWVLYLCWNYFLSSNALVVPLEKAWRIVHQSSVVLHVLYTCSCFVIWIRH